jgi:D-glycero-D-manno-heptose 1,7-bisphosphate phosphatase
LPIILYAVLSNRILRQKSSMNHNKAIFLDRDDTIIEDPGYISNPDQVKLIPSAAGALADLRKMGYKIVVVSNQSGIARGLITEQALAQIHERLKQLLAQQNVYLDRIYYCPFHPDGVIQKFRKDSDLRKPKPGMLLTAAKEMSIDLENSWMIGNDYKDIAAGKSAGCRTILIKSHTNKPVRQLSDPEADFEAINLRETVNIIKREIMSKPGIEPARPEQSRGVEPAHDVVIEPAKPIEEPPKPQPVEIPKLQEIQQSEIEPARTEPNRSARSELASTEPCRSVEPAQQVFENEIIETIAQKPQRPISPASGASDNQGSRTEKLLEEIKLLLQSRQRQEQYPDFSMLKLFAGLLQIMVLGCLFIALRYLILPASQYNAVFAALGFAIVFQVMALTIYIMHKDK